MTSGGGQPARPLGKSRRRARLVGLGVLLAVTLACASGHPDAFKQGMRLAYEGDWDAAVAYLTRAVQEKPNRADYRINLERAMFQASVGHLGRARDLERAGDLEGALVEYRRTLEYNPSNREAIDKVSQLERQIREAREAAKPRAPIDDMRDRARREMQSPLLSPTSREPLSLRFTQASTQDILNFIGRAAGINVMYERDFRPAPFSIELSGVALEDALNQIMAANQLWYKVVNDRTILIIPDNNQKRQQYEDQVIRTFYLSHADPQELAQLVSTVTRIPGVALLPTVAANKSANSLTVRGTKGMIEIIERIVEANDKPRAEVIVDVQILEVNRVRAQQYGLNLSQYAVGTVFSPEAPPVGGTGTSGEGSGGAVAQGLFNLSSITKGISTADFYMAVPQAIVKFLATDSETRQIAKPQLRGTEGQKLTLNLGDEIPVPSTVFTPIATGGTSVNPLTSFTYRPVGVNIEMTPRVTYEGEIVLDLVVESSNLGDSVNVAGNALPSFGSRKVTTRLRLREGESNLLAGLLSERERKAISGIPGVINVPILKDLLSSNDKSYQQTDIVMLLTPRIVRGHELTQDNLSPIHIGTQQNVGLTTETPVFGAPPPTALASAATPAPAGVSATRLARLSTRDMGKTVAVTITGNGRLVPGAVQELGQPERLVLDFPGVESSLPAVTPVGVADVERVRTAVNSRDPLVTRVVFDLSQRRPYRVDTSGQDRGEVLVMIGEGASGDAGAATAPLASVPAQPADRAVAQSPPPPAPAPPPQAPPASPSPGPSAPAQMVATVGSLRAPDGAPVPVLVTGPEDARLGGGPYSVPLSISDVSRLSVITLSLTYNPAVLKVRAVQEGGFLRQGGLSVTFAQQVDSTAGRIDVSMARTADATGASGSGLLAAVLFEPVAAGTCALTVSGAATDPDGAPIPLAFVPATVVVR